MANRTKIVNKLKKFADKDRQAGNVALERIAVDILVLSKGYVPQKGSFLQTSGRYREIAELNFRVEYGQEGPSKAYARYQEYGGDGKRTVRNYSKPGTGKRYLGRAGDEIANKALEYIISEKRKIRV